MTPTPCPPFDGRPGGGAMSACGRMPASGAGTGFAVQSWPRSRRRRRACRCAPAIPPFTSWVRARALHRCACALPFTSARCFAHSALYALRLTLVGVVNVNVNVFSLGLSNATEEQQVYLGHAYATRCWTLPVTVSLLLSLLLPPGNDCFAKREFENAIIYYSRAVAVHPSDARLYSNRSAAFLGLGRTAASLRDALVRCCVGCACRTLIVGVGAWGWGSRGRGMEAGHGPWCVCVQYVT
jgi:hypothetical protein